MVAAVLLHLYLLAILCGGHWPARAFFPARVARRPIDTSSIPAPARARRSSVVFVLLQLQLHAASCRGCWAARVFRAARCTPVHPKPVPYFPLACQELYSCCLGGAATACASPTDSTPHRVPIFVWRAPVARVVMFCTRCLGLVLCAMPPRRALHSPAVTNALIGLQLLGLRIDSDASVLHDWSTRLPYGMFDGHGSVLPAPDHVILHGLERCSLKTLFRALPKTQSSVVAASLSDALAACGLRRTRVYDSTRDKVKRLMISEWAAALAVASVACRRSHPAEWCGRPLSVSPVGAVLDVVDSLSAFASAAYFYPRVELDSGRIRRQRYKHGGLSLLSERFLMAVSVAEPLAHATP